MKVNETVELLESSAVRTLTTQLYGEGGVEANVRRYEDLLAGCEKMFGGEGDTKLLSSSGRTEISDNRTNHNHGKVLADSISLGCAGAVETNESNQVHAVSEAYNQDFTIDLNHLEPSEKRAGTTDPVKRPLRGSKDSGYRVGGLNVYITSNVIGATGVSSSASFKILLCSIPNTFFNEGRMNTVAYAHVSKLAENNYWGKAFGLLDQMTCAVSGPTTIDFMKSLVPKVEKIDFDFGSRDYSLIIVQIGKGHADLDADYSLAPAEMKKVARYFGRGVLFQTSEKQVIDNLAEVRQLTGGRSMLRALHFFEENRRVEAKALALKENRFKDLLNNITTSGSPSWKWLQNCFTSSDYQERGITVTLALTELSIAEKQKGACRVHGGDPVGVIMVVLPDELVDKFIHYIEKCTGEGGAYQMSVRPYEAICFNDLTQLRTAFFDVKRRDLRGSRLQFPRIPVVRRGGLRYNDIRVCGYQIYPGAIRTRGGLSEYD